tara:strand:+ start:630 stop:2390 length:1761 start_codon:yes stop_codon:yes gene_type:complete
MKSTAAKKEEFTFPSGGIADFYMEDHEIEALEKEEAEQEFGSAGIATFNPIARRMASYGRYGDDTVAHVETGELVVPKALIDSNPKLKDSIFSHLRELGVEDPEQYIVGSGVNSINPDTGMPEFFLKKIFKGIKKAVSGVARGVKKAFKGVGKILKKVAPIVLPIALAMTPLGPIYGAALGSGIGTLVSGGDIKDAFKSALIAGGTGALFSGFTGKGATFTEKVGNALSDPAGRLAQTASGVKGTFTGKGLTGEGTLFTDFVPTTEVPTVTSDASTGFQNQYADSGVIKTDVGTGRLQVGEAMTPGSDASDFLVKQAQDRSLSAIDQRLSDVSDRASNLLGSGTGDVASIAKEPSMFETAGDYLFRGGQSKADIAAAKSLARSNQVSKTLAEYGYKTLKDAPLSVQNAAIAAGDAAAKAAGLGLLARFGPSLALAGAGAAAGGFFKKPEDPELNIDDIQGETGSDLLAKDPSKYLVEGGDTRIRGADGQYVIPTNYQFMGQIPDFKNIYPQAFAADGGEIFPRRTGGIMPNEGTPGKDSVRAMLMPGEFVMTTDAVKGMGDGNNEKGINRMYDMMRNLESRGKAMA